MVYILVATCRRARAYSSCWRRAPSGDNDGVK